MMFCWNLAEYNSNQILSGGVDLSSVAKEIGQDGQSAGTQALETALGGLPPK